MSSRIKKIFATMALLGVLFSYQNCAKTMSGLLGSEVSGSVSVSPGDDDGNDGGGYVILGPTKQASNHCDSTCLDLIFSD